jgi:hypothetical protein
MARGWESKSIESQIDAARAHHTGAAIARAKAKATTPAPETLELIRKKETILLSRTRVVRELANARNPRYVTVLEKALADLDAQLSIIAPD